MKDHDDPFHHDTPFFHARVSPHRSLGRTGLAVVVGCVAAVSFAGGLLFWSIGAWPVIGFLGLDVVALYVALRLNARGARAGEDISVSATAIRVRRWTSSGAMEEWTANPFFARLILERDGEAGLARLSLRTRERSDDLGAFLAPPERARLADALGAALAAARRGGMPVPAGRD